MTHDDDLLDLIAVLALGALPAAEATELAAHIASCESCRSTYSELRETAGLVGYAAELAPGQLDELTAARLKSRVMREVKRSAGNGTALHETETIVPENPVPSRTGARWLSYATAAAALIVAGVIGADDAALHSKADRDQAQIAALQAQVSAREEVATHSDLQARGLDARLAAVLAPGGRHFSVPGGEVVTSGGRILIVLPHLPALPAGKVYQAWTVAKGAKALKPSITFTPDPDGVALIELPQNASNIAVLAVSVEPAGGSQQPTTPPKFVRALS